MNSITSTGKYPHSWKKEYVTPIPKVHPPSTEDDLRNISLTPFLSKIYEWFLFNWLLPFLLPHIDPGQLGGLKGCSTTHYLIKLYHFIQKIGDMPNNLPHSVLLALIDFSKAFNRIDHNLLITILSDYEVPGWLLKICFSYLSNRRMIVRFNQKESSEEALPGGGPQGTLLGGLFYIFLINKAGWSPINPDENLNPPPDIGDLQVRLKYWDDLTMGESINLKSKLCSSINRDGPKQYHDRFGLTLPPENSILQMQLNHLSDFSNSHFMKINIKKTKIFPFNFTKTLDFLPNLRIPGNPDPLEVEYSTKLLGVICSSDGKWKENTSYIVNRATSKLWMLRRLKWIGADREILLETWKLHIRSLLEGSVPLWHSSLTVTDSDRLEKVQKMAFSIILLQQSIEYIE